MSKVIMMCGVCGSGKTTYAKKKEQEGYIRLSIDEEMWKLYGRKGIDYPEEQYEKLLRNIYEKPQLVKPKLGKKPEWLDEEKTNFFPLKDLIRQIHGSNILNKRRNCISRFQEAYIDALKDYYKGEMNPKEVYDTFLNMKVPPPPAPLAPSLAVPVVDDPIPPTLIYKTSPLANVKSPYI